MPPLRTTDTKNTSRQWSQLVRPDMIVYEKDDAVRYNHLSTRENTRDKPPTRHCGDNRDAIEFKYRCAASSCTRSVVRSYVARDVCRPTPHNHTPAKRLAVFGQGKSQIRPHAALVCCFAFASLAYRQKHDTVSSTYPGRPSQQDRRIPGSKQTVPPLAAFPS